MEWSLKKKRKEKKQWQKKNQKQDNVLWFIKRKKKKKQKKTIEINRPFQMVIYPSPPIITKGAIITNLASIIMVTGTFTIMYNPLFKIYTTSVWFDPINFQQMS